MYNSMSFDKNILPSYYHFGGSLYSFGLILHPIQKADFCHHRKACLLFNFIPRMHHTAHILLYLTLKFNTKCLRLFSPCLSYIITLIGFLAAKDFIVWICHRLLFLLIGIWVVMHLLLLWIKLLWILYIVL